MGAVGIAGVRLIPLHAASIVFSLPGHIAFELGPVLRFDVEDLLAVRVAIVR